MKHVQACLSSKKDRESNFLGCDKRCEVGASLFMCGKDLITQFQPLRRYFEACAGLFKW